MATLKPLPRGPGAEPRGVRHIERLDWDTEFFGVQIGRFARTTLPRSRFTQILRSARSEGIECVYLELDADNVDDAALVSAHGFELVDVRILLDLDLKGATCATAAALGVDVGPARDEDPSTLVPIAERSARVSRYFADRRFRRHAARLYRRWIVEACRGWADVVLVARREGAPVGFISCKRDGASAECGKIDLVCVDPRHSGQGIGSVLVSAALEWFRRHGFRRVRVVTQGRNLAALRLYERMAFRVERVSLFYHGWLRPRPRPR